MLKRTLIASGIILATGVAAFAHKGATGVVKERMDQMLLYKRLPLFLLSG